MCENRIRLKNIQELQEVDFVKTTTVAKSPAKPKRTRNVKAANKTKADAECDVKETTKSPVKRTRRSLSPPREQLRIDSFFKASAKTYKIENSCPSISRPQPPIMTRSRRTGAKANRLFREEEVSIIDLCSDDEKKPSIKVESETDVPCKRTTRQSAATSNATVIASSICKENIPSKPNKKERPCPPYKVIDNTTFAVDAFNFGDIPNVTHYFLTHYHADHYVGLTRKFSHPLYMSPVTAALVRTFIPIDEQYLHEIEINNPIVIKNIEITAVDANHCPGAIMLFFKTTTGRCILHTGDFRATQEMESFPVLWNNIDIDILYLDTTYLTQKYDFCYQTESIHRTIHLVREFRNKHADKRILYVCGTYLIGKEKIWLALAEKFNLLVWTEPKRQKIIDCLNWPELQMRMCNKVENAELHIVGMGIVSYQSLVKYFDAFSKDYDMLLAIRPSGWEKNSKPSYGKKISIIGIEYSEHSSYSELHRFVRFVKPKQVISTVPVGRDPFVTSKVPESWYKYAGNPAPLRNSFQPSISNFLSLPKPKPPKSAAQTV